MRLEFWQSTLRVSRIAVDFLSLPLAIVISILLFPTRASAFESRECMQVCGRCSLPHDICVARHAVSPM